MKPKLSPLIACVRRPPSTVARLLLFAKISAGALHLHRVRLERGKRMCTLECHLSPHPLTARSFLGVALTKVLLESRGHISRRPILVVCTTNHALDSFLKDIQRAGVTKFVRLGGNSKETWTKAFSLQAAARGLKKTTLERSRESQARRQVEGLFPLSFNVMRQLTRD